MGNQGDHMRATVVFGLLAALGSTALPDTTRVPSNLPAVKSADIPAMWVFGDSTVDSGNNNDLNNTVFKANFYPYGIDFPNQEATGRFSNGYLAPDFIAQRVSLPLAPPYFNIETSTSQYIQGVNFASAGSGIIASTSVKLGTIHLETQIEAFVGNYREKLIQEVGEIRTAYILREGIYICSTGTNDYLNNYKLDSGLQGSISAQEFQNLMVQGLVSLVQKIHGAGGRRMALLSLIPLGCLPSQKTIYASDITNGSECVGELNDFAQGLNVKLKAALANLQASFPDSIIVLAEIYDIFDDMFQNPTKYGMQFTREACCGVGLVEAAISCNAATELCSDASQYVFWDSFHPSQKAYEQVSNYLWEQYSPKLLAPLPYRFG